MLADFNCNIDIIKLFSASKLEQLRIMSMLLPYPNRSPIKTSSFKNTNTSSNVSQSETYSFSGHNSTNINNDSNKNKSTTKPKKSFYLDPYITCRWCNLMSFVDITSVRCLLVLPKNISELVNVPNESLPPCRRCLRADMFYIGK